MKPFPHARSLILWLESQTAGCQLLSPWYLAKPSLDLSFIATRRYRGMNWDRSQTGSIWWLRAKVAGTHSPTTFLVDVFFTLEIFLPRGSSFSTWRPRDFLVAKSVQGQEKLV